MARQAVNDSQLTAREHEVLALLGRGLCNQEIALALNVAVKTVEIHLSSIYHKLGVKSRTQGMLWELSNRHALLATTES